MTLHPPPSIFKKLSGVKAIYGFSCITFACHGALLPPRISGGAGKAMALGPQTNKVDYILAEKVVGLIRYRYHGLTRATNVFSVIDVTNAPAAPVTSLQISVPSDAVVLSSPTLDFTAPQQLKVTAITTFQFPITAGNEFFKWPLPNQTAHIRFTDSPSPTAVQNNVYIGTNSGVNLANAVAIINIGTNSDYIVSGLAPGQFYYFSVTAQDNDGVESPYSAEFVYFVPINDLIPSVSAIR